MSRSVGPADEDWASWTPDRSSSVPLTEQVVDMVRSRVAQGRWGIGTTLPSQREMARRFNLNRSTIGQAMRDLAALGIVDGRRGGGTTVVGNTWSTLLPRSLDWTGYVSSGSFRANSSVIQRINSLEFESGMIRLGTGEPDPRLFPRDMWTAASASVMERIPSLGYPEPRGLLGLREALCARLIDVGIDATPSRMLITSGALQALQLVSVCLLKPGSFVYTEEPSYVKSLQVFPSAGMTLRGIPMDADGLDVRALERILSSQSRPSILYTIPTNHNPTGVTMTARRRADLMELCSRYRLPIIEDAAYEELCDGPRPRSLKSLDSTDSVIYVGTASKSLAPGLRVGWVVAPEAIVARLGDVKMQMDYGASAVSQWLLAELLRDGSYDRWLGVLTGELHRRRMAALEVLRRRCRSLATWNLPHGGFYIWMTLNHQLDMTELFHRAADARVLLNPGDLYDYRSTRSLRMSFAYAKPEEFDLGVARIVDIVRDMAATDDVRRSSRPGRP